MSLEIGAATGNGQLTATRVPDPQAPINKAKAAYDMLTKSTAKTEGEDRQRLELAEQSGKGQNIDVMA
jgi:hypothetical protein